MCVCIEIYVLSYITGRSIPATITLNTATSVLLVSIMSNVVFELESKQCTGMYVVSISFQRHAFKIRH